MNNNSNRNNNNNNNRRRGRNNNSNNNRGGGGGGGGNQGNRIDSRARGNAPQMLEKYRKLAHDASLNDDRVLTEYYLQFADHYFRVMADQKAQRDEQQVRQGGRRDAQPGYDEDGEEARDFGREDGREDSRQDRDEPRDYGRDDNRNYGERDRPERDRSERDRPERDRPEREPRQQSGRNQRSGGENVAEGFEGDPDGGNNPFSPEPREPREPRKAKPARRRAEPRSDEPDFAPAATLSADILPPAIARGDDPEPEDKPVRKALRPRTRRPRADEDGEETLEAVN